MCDRLKRDLCSLRDLLKKEICVRSEHEKALLMQLSLFPFCWDYVDDQASCKLLRRKGVGKIVSRDEERHYLPGSQEVA
jgi:hypothetical protein